MAMARPLFQPLPGMGLAVESFQRRNFLMPTARFDQETREAIILDSRELDYRLALRVLRERVVEASGLLEDGTAGEGPRPILGRMLDLKPISTMEDGDLLPIEKVRNYTRAVDKLHDFIVEFSHIEQMYILQNEFETEAAQLLERLETVYPHREFPVIGYSPSLAVHIGPKAMGVVVYEGVR
jgi:hypothetical protein